MGVRCFQCCTQFRVLHAYLILQKKELKQNISTESTKQINKQNQFAL